jgi:hypothetical protein
MSAANESPAWVDAGEHRYQVKRIPRKSPTGQDFIKVLKWGEGGASDGGGAALSVPNGGQLINAKKGEGISSEAEVRAILLRFDMPGRLAKKMEDQQAAAQAAGAASEGRGKRTQRVVTQAEPVAIGSSFPWEFQRDLGKEQRRRDSGASASLLCAISTLLTMTHTKEAGVLETEMQSQSKAGAGQKPVRDRSSELFNVLFSVGNYQLTKASLEHLLAKPEVQMLRENSDPQEGQEQEEGCQSNGRARCRGIRHGHGIIPEVFHQFTVRPWR